MEFKQIYDKTVYAFEHDEVFELLTGQKGYDYQAPMVPISIPTHHNYIFDDGIYPFYRNIDQQEQKDAFCKMVAAYRKMMVSSDEVLVWWALSLLYGQKLSEEKHKKSPFIMADMLLAEIKPYLLANQSKLEASQAYAGKRLPNGLWGDVQRYNRLLLKHFDYVLLTK